MLNVRFPNAALAVQTDPLMEQTGQPRGYACLAKVAYT